MTPRAPTRLYETSLITDDNVGYPNELTVDPETGDLTLILNDGSKKEVNTLNVESSGSGNVISKLTVDGRKVIIERVNALTQHPTIIKSDPASTIIPINKDGGTVLAVKNITFDTNGHVTGIETETINFAEFHQTTLEEPLTENSTTDYNGTITCLTNIDLDDDNHVKKFHFTKYTLPSLKHTSVDVVEDTTSTLNLDYAGTFTVIDTIVKDANGHITSINTKTLKLPSAQSIPTLESLNGVPSTRTVNGKALSADITLTAADVGAAASNHTHTASQVGAVPVTGGTFTGDVSFSNKVHLTGIDTSNSIQYFIGIKPFADGGDVVWTSANTMPAQIGAAITRTYNATVGTAWSGTTAPFTQNVAVSGILATDAPIADVNLARVVYANKDKTVEAYSKFYRIVTYANGITVYSDEKTTVNVPIQLKVIR